MPSQGPGWTLRRPQGAEGPLSAPALADFACVRACVWRWLAPATLQKRLLPAEPDSEGLCTKASSRGASPAPPARAQPLRFLC